MPNPYGCQELRKQGSDKMSDARSRCHLHIHAIHRVIIFRSAWCCPGFALIAGVRSCDARARVLRSQFCRLFWSYLCIGSENVTCQSGEKINMLCCSEEVARRFPSRTSKFPPVSGRKVLVSRPPTRRPHQSCMRDCQLVFLWVLNCMCNGNLCRVGIRADQLHNVVLTVRILRWSPPFQVCNCDCLSGSGQGLPETNLVGWMPRPQHMNHRTTRAGKPQRDIAVGHAG